eukprot:6208297-Pleurochrysis_carterae.AAC.1
MSSSTASPPSNAPARSRTRTSSRKRMHERTRTRTRTQACTRTRLQRCMKHARARAHAYARVDTRIQTRLNVGETLAKRALRARRARTLTSTCENVSTHSDARTSSRRVRSHKHQKRCRQAHAHSDWSNVGATRTTSPRAVRMPARLRMLLAACSRQQKDAGGDARTYTPMYLQVNRSCGYSRSRDSRWTTQYARRRLFPPQMSTEIAAALHGAQSERRVSRL